MASWVGFYSVVPHVRCLMDQPLCCSAADTGMWGQRSYGDGSTYYVWLSNIIFLPWLPAFLHRCFPPQCPPSRPLSLSVSAVNSSSCPGIAPQFLCSSSQPLHLLGDLHSCLGYVWLWQGLSDSHSHLGCHRVAASLSALNVSPQTQSVAPMWASDPCFSSPTCQGLVQSY